MIHPKRLLIALFLLTTHCFGSDRPNIILMMADDLGWGDPSYNGGVINTPTLDTMAASGLRFDRFYSASAVCSPTRASCLTGRHPHRLGITNANTGRLEADETPLSEVLDSIGYATGHFGKWHLGTLTSLRSDSNRGSSGNTSVYSPPWQHSYDYTFATEAKVPTFHPMRRTVNGLPEPVNFTDPNFYGTRYWTTPTNLAAAEGIAVDVTDNLSGDDSRIVMDRVIPFIDNAVAAGNPFFTVIWFHTPHKPLTDPDGTSAVDSNNAYIDAIVNMDTQIARLRTHLDTLSVTNNTMLWFCSDNGPEDGVGSAGPYRARKRSLHEGGVRVPGILVWPEKIPTARITDFPSVTSDYFPTILDYLCIEVPNQKPIDGISLRSVIENTVTTRPQPIGFNYLTSRSWVNQQYKLISKDSGTSFELFDLLADPSETTNIATSNPEIVARMTNEFLTWQAAVAADTTYIPPSTNTTVLLTTPINPVTSNFTVHIAFSQPVTGLTTDDFSISNGTTTTLTGSGASYTLNVTPTLPGIVTIELPADRVLDLDSNPNLASNTLNLQFGTPPTTNNGSIVIDDHFDGNLTQNWISQGNTQAATHNITSSNSILTSNVIATATDSNRGIVSIPSVNPLEKAGFSVSFVVDSVGQSPEINGFFIGLVSDNSLFYRSNTTRNFGLTFFGLDSRTNSQDGFGLNYGDNFATTGASTRLSANAVQLNSFLDGFTATFHADSSQWHYEITGLNNTAGKPTLFTDSGTWVEAGTTFETLFGIDTSWHVVTSNQRNTTGTHSASFERIRLVSGSEPSPAILSIIPNLTAGDLDLTWSSVEGLRYEVERSSDLKRWFNLDTVTANQRTTTFTDTDADANRIKNFYRIRTP